MRTYILRRLLLIPITLLGITAIVFYIVYKSPGGPVQQKIQHSLSQQQGNNAAQDSNALSSEEIEQIQETYGVEHNVWKSYAIWLGVVPKEYNRVKKIVSPSIVNSTTPTTIDMTIEESYGKKKPIKVTFQQGRITEIQTTKQQAIRDINWHYRLESPADREKSKLKQLARLNWLSKQAKKNATDNEKFIDYRLVLYQQSHQGILQGNLGKSTKYQDNVTSMILSRMPISIYLGGASVLIMYLVSIPLGILKAIKHNSPFDTISSIFIFIGYSIPGYVLGGVLIIFLGVRGEYFPIAGIVSDNFDELSFGAQIIDILHHGILPIIAYSISSFAYITMMMKNNMLENLSAEYIRTAMAKGATYRQAVVKHAFRNSFIPLATGLGGVISILIAGSILIEKVFDIDGFGLLQFQAILDKDIPLIMGVLTLSAFLMLVGNLLSDIIVAWIDPRIKYN